MDMYGANNGAHSYSTPASPTPYSNAHAGDGKPSSDKELAALFRATAANVTQLYKEASNIGQNAYKAGYDQCYSDMCDFVLAAQAEGALAGSGDGQRQLLVQQLVEFARMKRLAPRQTRFDPASDPRLSPVADHVHDHQSRSSADLTTDGGGAVNAAVPAAQTPAFRNSAPGHERLLDPFELMDIEPPRRRQRRDDIEMG
ncbi:hypothetical protein LPJ63_001195 [Coemansia sp. RSA 2711]|nr:hypothetical protein LPJ63_001195 [Coemansia sp. RSA 2711]